MPATRMRKRRMMIGVLWSLLHALIAAAFLGLFFGLATLAGRFSDLDFWQAVTLTVVVWMASWQASDVTSIIRIMIEDRNLNGKDRRND